MSNANASASTTIPVADAVMSAAALSIMDGAAVTDTVITLHPSEIYVDPETNGRHPSSDNKKSVRELANDIAIRGQMQPVIVRPWTMPELKPDGTAWTEEERDELAGKTCQLVFGYQRYAAVTLLLEEGVVDSIKATVKDWDDNDALDANISENLKRKDLNMMDRSHAINLMLERGRNGKEVAKSLGISAPMVSKLKSFKLLNEELQAFVASGDLTVDGAYELSSKDEKEQAKAAKSIAASLAEYASTIEGAAGLTDAEKKKKRAKKKAAEVDSTVKKAPTIRQAKEVFEFIGGGCKETDAEGNVVEPAVAPGTKTVALAKDIVKFIQGKISGKVMTTRLMSAVG